MRHVVTGGSGFTGATLMHQLLNRGDEVVNFDLKPPADPKLASSTRFVHGDIRKLDNLARLELRPDDVVYHLAARQFADAVPWRGRDAWFHETNVRGTQNVVDAMRAGRASHLVYFSTDMTYGLPKTCPVRADHLQNPLGPYGRSKYAAEKILLGTDTIRATIFRPRLITGPGRLGIMGKLFTLIKAGLPVPMIGSGDNRYQMVGVGDCARAAILAMEAGCPSGPFNLGSAAPPKARDLLLGIIDHAKSRSFLIPVAAGLLKPVLGTLDAVGLTLLFPEQFSIADVDILLDTSDTRRILGWAPLHGDIDMMKAAYDAFAR